MPGISGRVLSTLDFLTKHFLVLSSAIAAAGLFLAVITLAGYNHAFDVRLLWIVEYSDLVKIGLVFVALICAYITLLDSYFSTAINAITPEKWYKSPLVWTTVIIYLAFLALVLWGDYKAQTPHWSIHVMIAAYVVTCVFMVWASRRFVRNFRDSYARRSIGFGASVVYFVVTGAYIYGSYVREFGPYNSSVTAKDMQFSNVLVVESLSRYTAIFDRRTYTVIPTSDISSIVIEDNTASSR